MTNLAESEELLRDFLNEAGDMLDDVDNKLVELERRPDDAELLNAVFRGFHTIKGGAGFLEVAPLVELCHRGENLLDALRNRRLILTADIMDVVLDATGEVRGMFAALSSGAAPTPASEDLLSALECALQGDASARRSKRGDEAPVEIPHVAGASSTKEPDWAALFALVSPGAQPPKETPRRDEPVASNSAPSQKAPPPAAKDASLRIDVARFDQILNLTGEIGLTKNRLLCVRQQILQDKSVASSKKLLDQVVRQLDALVNDLQNAVMKARMQPVGRVFQKYSRLARDVARQLGKEVELVLQGEETELDKTLLDELHDPLVHLIRNAVDHGVESPAERTASGKPAKATVTLSARQAGDSIIIEVDDDGKGIRSEVIRQKAVEKGLIAAHEANVLSEKEAYELIFLPGFSTKSEISDISGRGVGMDVVKTNIQRLSGQIEIASQPGRGSRFTIRLPLTLAILPVLVARLGDQPFALPLTAVREVVNLNQDDLQSVSGKPTLVVRGEVLPVFYLADLLGWASRGTPEVGIVAQIGGMDFILGVDDFIGRDDVVIKPVDAFKPKGVAGATVSREGVLVLVLDLRELLETLH